MYEQKPTTSLIEDLEQLGLLSEGEKAAKANKSQLSENAGVPPVHADATQDAEMMAKSGMAPDAPPAPKAAPAPKAPAPKAPAPKAPAAGPTDDGMGAVPGTMDAAPGPASDASDAADDQDDDGEDEMAAYENAWDCVKQYYTLNERNEQLSEDDYKTVINALAFIVETQGKYMGPDLLDKDPQTLPGGEEAKTWKGDSANDPTDKVQGTNAMRKVKGFKYHLASPKPGEKAESVENLVNELKSLTQQTESDDEMQEIGNKIIEGFEAIRDTAREVAENIASQLKESNEKVTEKHPRLKLGRFFEGVSNDAKLLLKAISEREQTDVDDAIEDLNSLSRDLKRGLAQL